MPIHIKLIEPVSARYVYINKASNTVHLMFPLVAGDEISTDNSCMSNTVTHDFIRNAEQELIKYKNALLFDIKLLEAGTPERKAKEERLKQIEVYSSVIPAMRDKIGPALKTFYKRASNLYSVELTPLYPHSRRGVINPAFSIKKGAFYLALMNSLNSLTIEKPSPRTKLTQAVLSALPKSSAFTKIQKVLANKFLTLYGLSIDFTKESHGSTLTKQYINSHIGYYYNKDAEIKDYVDALLWFCAEDVWECIPSPTPFYSILHSRRTDLIQFFLAILNVYSKARGISTQNFGKILEQSKKLSEQLVDQVTETLTKDESVEEAICAFFNTNASAFKLSHRLSAEDVRSVKELFERIYPMVMANEFVNCDDFLILDKEATGERAKCVSHQGAICVNFAEILDPFVASPHRDYFKRVLTDFAVHPSEIPHKNEWVGDSIELDLNTLVKRLNLEEDLENIPKAISDICSAHPDFQTSLLLQNVAKGRQEEAHALLNIDSTNTQRLLRASGVFTDYSGRKFNCTAYEYAFWAKDYYMLRMLDSKMNKETRAFILERIQEMESKGLPYDQEGTLYCSNHFDFTPLKTALKKLYDQERIFARNTGDKVRAKIAECMLTLSLAQHNVPAHVAQQYCRKDQSFIPRPTFTENTFPRTLTLSNYRHWFSLYSPHARTLIVFRGKMSGATQLSYVITDSLTSDRNAVHHLEQVSTKEIANLREQLNPVGMKRGRSLVV